MFHIPLPQAHEPAPAPSASFRDAESTTAATSTAAAQGAEVDESPTDKAEKERDFFKVPVTEDMTVLSVAARFGISDHVLRQYNPRLQFHHYCMFVDHVWVPRHLSAGPAPSRAPTEPELQADMVRAFIARAEAEDEAEARFYLSESSWNLEDALVKHAEDAAWEQEHAEEFAEQQQRMAAREAREKVAASKVMPARKVLTPSAPPLDS